MKKELSAGTKDQQRTDADNGTSASVEASPMLSAALSDIDKGNILISEFDGRKFYAYKDNSSYDKKFNTYQKCFDWIRKQNLHGYKPEIGWQLGFGKYDTSFEWLMEVVEKIESMKIIMEITLSTVNVFSELNGFEDFYIKGKTKKEAVWLAVVGIIKWYNDNTAAVGSR
jgi:hypothetical protein